MSSPGAGADITPQEAHDLLNKWTMESTKVQGLLVSANGFRASVLGTVIPFPNGGVGVVLDRNPPLTTFFEFKPGLAVRLKYGDARVFPTDKFSEIPGAPKLSSNLGFVFPDDSVVTLSEVAD